MPPAVASAAVLDAQGRAHRLDEAWSRGPALVYVLRHFGCIGCALAVAELAPRLTELREAGLTVWLVGNGQPVHIAGFLERNGLEGSEVAVFTEPTLSLHRALDLRRSVTATFGPAALWASARALGRGLRNRPVEGDSLQQGGALLVDPGGRVVVFHRDRHLGDHVPPVTIVNAALGILAERAPGSV